VSCPICEKRKPSRFCPAKGEKICAVCCGTEREVTIDCPADCPYLIAAHRYEDEHRKSVAEADIPFRDVRFSSDAIYARQPIVSGLGLTILKFAAAQPALADPDALSALHALADTYKTLTTGIYYEKPPDAPLSRTLYAELAQFLQQTKQGEAERAGFSTLKDSEILYVLIFLLRLGSLRTNGRPRARRFLEFLRSQFPDAQEAAREESRIIVP
jgi:hypothetical protein